MKTESEDFSPRALLAINMKEEMLLRRMLRYIVIVPLVRAQPYVAYPTLAICLCSCHGGERTKSTFVARSHLILSIRLRI